MSTQQYKVSKYEMRLWDEERDEDCGWIEFFRGPLMATRRAVRELRSRGYADDISILFEKV
jgi:hypothetical protein